MNLPLATFGNLVGPDYLIIALSATVFWLWMLIDSINNQSLRDTQRVVWVLVILFTQIVGAILYFLIARGGNANRPRI